MSMTAAADSFAGAPLPRRFVLPAVRLLPRRIIALDAGQNAVSFALRFHFNGRISLAPERAGSRGGSFVLALDPAICFRRRGRLEPKSRAELRMVAADFFPFGADATSYALSGAGGEEPSYCALPTQDLANILDRFPRAAAVIVAPPDPARLQAAIEERLDRGDVADLMPDAVRLINPAIALSGVLAAVLAIGIVASTMLWSSHQQALARAGRVELAHLEAQTARLFERRQAIVRMAAELQQEQAFAKAPSRGALDLIAKTLAVLPAGAYVDRIEYGKDTLTISGWGNGVADWIKTAGVTPKSVTSEKMPLTDRFVIIFAVASK